MTEDEILELLTRDPHQIFAVRFTDDSEAHITDCRVRADERGQRECFATALHVAGDVISASDEELYFALGEVAEVRPVQPLRPAMNRLMHGADAWLRTNQASGVRRHGWSRRIACGDH